MTAITDDTHMKLYKLFASKTLHQIKCITSLI